MLVATDLDGTLLRSDLSVSPRTVAAIAAVQASGTPVVPVTARQPLGLAPIAEAAGLTGWALCGNGALGYHLASGEVLFETLIDVDAQQNLTSSLRTQIPGTVFAGVREGGHRFIAERAYPGLATFTDHMREPSAMETASLAGVTAEPNLKLIARHPSIAPRVLLNHVLEAGLHGFEATWSGAPFVEIMAAGVDKGVGLARLARHLGVDRADVIAFGDAPNDVGMIRWAGRGIAMANACPEVRAVADESTSDNNADGVALVLEVLTGSGPAVPMATG